jgi:hypothetical protein
MLDTLTAPRAQTKTAARKGNQITADLAQRIRTEHQAYMDARRTSIKHALVVGGLLVEAKQHVKHGEWESWVKRNCKMSDRTARDYMRLAENRKEIEVKTAAAADLAAGIKDHLKLIAEPKPDRPKKGASSPLPVNVAQPVNEHVTKRTTKHDIAMAWFNASESDRLAFMADHGLMYRDDALEHEAMAEPAVTLSPDALDEMLNDDLSIPEFLRVIQ